MRANLIGFYERAERARLRGPAAEGEEGIMMMIVGREKSPP